MERLRKETFYGENQVNQSDRTILYILASFPYPARMRHFWVALLCIVFSVSGSMIQAAHTAAHAQIPAGLETHDNEDHGHDHASHDDDHGVRIFDAHHHAEGHSGDHGAELHLTAIGVSPFSAAPPLPEAEAKIFLADLQQPSPLLPPDPDPDRA